MRQHNGDKSHRKAGRGSPRLAHLRVSFLDQGGGPDAGLQSLPSPHGCHSRSGHQRAPVSTRVSSRPPLPTALQGSPPPPHTPRGRSPSPPRGPLGPAGPAPVPSVPLLLPLTQWLTVLQPHGPPLRSFITPGRSCPRAFAQPHPPPGQRPSQMSPGLVSSHPSGLSSNVTCQTSSLSPPDPR